MTNTLLKDGTVISFDEATKSIKVLEKASILIQGDRIARISESVNDLDLPADVEVVDVSGKIVSPGFANTHSHMWMTAYRSLAADCTLMEYFPWLSQMGSASRSFNPDDIYISALEGYLDALNAGVTTVVEHAHQDWAENVFEPAYNAAVDGGARVWYCFGINDQPHYSAETQYQGLARLRERKDDPHGLVSIGVALDSVAQMDKENVAKTKAMIKQMDLKAITLHFLGGPWFGGSRTGSPAALSDHGFQDLDIPVIFSHGPFMTNADHDALRKHNWNVSITPESEMHCGHGQKSSKFVLDQASLGVDINFTFSGDMLTQTRLFLQHTRAEQYAPTLDAGKIPQNCPFDVEEAFLLATRHGGLAVRREDVGVLKEGAKADIVVIDGESPNMLGWTNAVAAVVLHANVGDIEHVLVDGEFRKRDRKLVLKKGNWGDISKRFASTARRIQKEHKDGRPSLEGQVMGMELGEVESVSTRR